MPTRRPNWSLLLPACFLVLLVSYAWGRKAASTRSGGGTRAGGGALDVAQQREARISFLDELSRRVDTEAADAAWKQETEATITRVLEKQLGPAVNVAEATCAATACRAKLDHPESPRIPDDQFVRFTLHRESLGTMELQLDTRAERTTTLYFLRRGRSPAK